MRRYGAVTRLGLAVALTVMAGAAEAQTNCAPRASALAQLSDRWGETRRSTMLANGRVIEVYAAAQTGTWTILATSPDGRSCVMVSGIAYEDVMPEPVGVPG